MFEAAHQPSSAASEASNTPMEPQNQAPSDASQKGLSPTPNSKATSKFDSSSETLRPSDEMQEEKGNSIDRDVWIDTLPFPDCMPPSPDRRKRKRPREDIGIEYELDASPTDDNEPLAIGISESKIERMILSAVKSALHRSAPDSIPRLLSEKTHQLIEDGRRTPPRRPATEAQPDLLSPTVSCDKDKQQQQRLFDAGKTAVLNLVALQRMNIHALQTRLATYAAESFQTGRFEDSAVLVQEDLNVYSDAVRNLDFMREKAKLGYDKDPFLMKSSRALERGVFENLGLIPDHVLPQGELPPPEDQDQPLLFNESDGRYHANEQITKKQRLERFAMASFGGLLIIVPMLIMANVPGKVASLVTSCVAIIIFAGLITLGTKLGPHEVLASVAAYAAVLVVFVGLSLEKR